MKVFLDECLDWRLGRDLAGHEVKTARQMGWTAVKNGELLSLASRHFDVFVTVDRGISFQQNLATLGIAVVVLRAKSSRLSQLQRLVVPLLACLATIERGTVAHIGAQTCCNADTANFRDAVPGWIRENAPIASRA